MYHVFILAKVRGTNILIIDNIIFPVVYYSLSVSHSGEVSEDQVNYMLQPSRMYMGENINTFGRGSLVMERPGCASTHTLGRTIISGGVHGSIGAHTTVICLQACDLFVCISRCVYKTVTSLRKSVVCLFLTRKGCLFCLYL